MEVLLKGGASREETIPFNVLRYARDNDKLLFEFGDLYFLDKEFTMAGSTILRPYDETLKKLIADMKKIDAAPPSAKFVSQQEKGLVYVLKGAIAPGILHASHWYVSRANRAFAIYMERRHGRPGHGHASRYFDLQAQGRDA